MYHLKKRISCLLDIFVSLENILLVCRGHLVKGYNCPMLGKNGYCAKRVRAVYDGLLRGPVTLTPIAKCLAVDLMTESLRFKHPTLACGANALTVSKKELTVILKSIL